MNYGLRIKADSRDRTWMADAACKDQGPDQFFPASPDAPVPAICGICPVRQECGDYGLTESAGVWGGRNQTERERIVRKRRKGAA